MNIILALQQSPKYSSAVKDVRAVDVFEENNVIYLVFNYKLGDNLKDSILKMGRNNLSEADVKQCAT